jgi:hypothetical protein
MKPNLRADLTERLVGLYKLIIDFQMQSVLRFYRSRTKNFFRGTINYDSWDKKLQNITDGDAALVSKFETAISASSLQALKPRALLLGDCILDLLGARGTYKIRRQQLQSHDEE